ncbi:hypothetical protein ACMGE7_01895 [Macrococcus equi]|uniref:hypothetical protein n=1 Tax=Macrococcus equi TaxID=3395462 RepID=UPI0039BE618A
MKKIIFNVSDQPVVTVQMTSNGAAIEKITKTNEFLAKLIIPKLAKNEDVSYGDLVRLVRFYAQKVDEKEKYTKMFMKDLAEHFNYKITDIEVRKNLSIEFVGYDN